MWSVNPNLPVASVRTLQEIVRASLATTSFTLVMLAIAGAMALLLGVSGIYGVISYSVSQRTREIGIRMALGARAQEVRAMFLRYGFRLAALGIACGLVVAIASTRLMASLLFETSPLDPVTYLAVSIGPRRRRGAGQLRAGRAGDGGESGRVPEGGVAIGFDRTLTTPRARR